MFSFVYSEVLGATAAEDHPELYSHEEEHHHFEARHQDFHLPHSPGNSDESYPIVIEHPATVEPVHRPHLPEQPTNVANAPRPAKFPEYKH